ncbi:MAG: hypothetical protein GQ558_04870, partial [Thermoplasmata archaeon]|nr:hypothetical protein [Thermoplasmata archaeon]
MAIAIFFVVIMIGAAMFVAFHELPHDEDTGGGREVLVWDMNIYKEKEATYRYKADGLSLRMRFPDSPQMNDVLLKNRMVEVRYEVEDLLVGPMNGHIIKDRVGIVSGNSIRYEEVFDYVDLVYIVGANGLKEYLVLKKEPRFLSGDLILRSQLHYPPSALEPYSVSDPGVHNSFETSDLISLYDSRQQEVLRIAPPVVFDSTIPPGGSLSRYNVADASADYQPDEGTRTVDVKVPDTEPSQHATVGTTRISENKDGASMATIVPWEYLSSPSTVYPVFIDPTISSPITDNQWYQDALVMLESNLSIVSGGSLNLYNVTLQVNHTDVDPYHIEVSSNASFNVYRSVIEPNATAGSEPFEFNSMGDLTIQDSIVNYTLD